MTTFLDSNILIYLSDSTANLHQWSINELNACKLNGPAIIADIVYCEVAVGMATQADVDAVVQKFALERLPSDDAVLWRAAAAYGQFLADKKAAKQAGEDSPNRPTVLPDFLVGALAEASGGPLITNDSRNFAKYFPGLKVIRPEAAQAA